MATDSELQQLARDAKVMTEAAKILDDLADDTSNLDTDMDGLDDEADLDEAIENIETAVETVEQVSLSMTMVLAHNGVVPDFDDALYSEDEGDDESSPAFQ